MKKYVFIFIVLLGVPLHSHSVFAEAAAISLQAGNFEHIVFSRIKANHHSYQHQQLQIKVESSSSFLMKSFARVKQVSRVSFEWSAAGRPQIKDAQHEEQRSGDDAVFKLGLLLKADDSSFNPFIPSWMKRVESLLRFPSENMIYLVVDAKHVAGEQWLNPYNSRVTMIAVDSVSDEQGWQKSSYHFESPVKVVALWLMSDGDNTGSSFSVRIKNIKIE